MPSYAETSQPIIELIRQHEEHGLSQTQAAKLCGLEGKQARKTLSLWEHGTRPSPERRQDIAGYLWDALEMRKDPEAFLHVWNEILVRRWKPWDEIRDDEWGRLTNKIKPVLGSGPYPATTAARRGSASRLPDMGRDPISDDGEFIYRRTNTALGQRFWISPTIPVTYARIAPFWRREDGYDLDRWWLEPEPLAVPDGHRAKADRAAVQVLEPSRRTRELVTTGRVLPLADGEGQGPG